MQLIRPRRALAATMVAMTAVLAGCGSHNGTGASSPTGPSPSPSTATHHRTGPICPLTGAPAGKHDDIHRVALAVKVDNIDAARPQAGLNDADIVVEELVEGGLTRLMAIYQCGSASSVGPIRSARISDADLLALLHGSVLGYSGANPADLPPIEAHSDSVLVSFDASPQYFHRDYSRPAPHNVFSATATLLHAGVSRRHGLHAPRPLFRYGALPTRSPAPRSPAIHRATEVRLSWPAASATWTWRGGHYLRDQNGTPDTLVGGAQASATNVVVLGVSIASTGLHDVLGSPSPLDVTVGHNPVWVFRNGKEITGTWQRRSVSSPLRLRLADGQQIRLAPGRTWLELLPRPSRPTVTR